MQLTLDEIKQACLEAAALLPRQGPITKFAFLNPLQGLESEHFDEVMRQVGAVYNNEAYLDDDHYRQKLSSGRIVESDLRDVLAEELGTRADELVAGLTPRSELRLAMLVNPFHFGQRRELDWVLAETESLERIRDEVNSDVKRSLLKDFKYWVLEERHPTAMSSVADVLGWPSSSSEHHSDPNLAGSTSESSWEAIYLHMLWSVVQSGVQTGDDAFESHSHDHALSKHPLLSHASMAKFLEMTSDGRVDTLMIQFTAAFLDQGYSQISVPGAERGYWSCFKQLYSQFSWLAPRWRRKLPGFIRDIEQSDRSPADCIQISLRQLGISRDDSPAFIAAALLSLRGYAGMLWQSETRPDLFRKPSPPGTLVEFLAVRLLLLTLANKDSLVRPTDSANLRSHVNSCQASIETEQLAFLLFELSQVLQWSPQTLLRLTDSQWQDLNHELRDFGDYQRRRIFHIAFERKLARMALQAFWERARQPTIRPEKPSLQLVCCIDAREESLRRHLEELDPTIETFGIAGFFGVAMYYRGLGDANFSALCPIIITPKHWVTEEAVYTLEQSDRTRAKARRYLGSAQRRFAFESRGSLGGAIVSTLVGPLATIPMLSRILLPRTTARMNRTARQFIAPPKITRLHLERSLDCPPCAPTEADDGSINDDGLGFTLDEMVQIADRALRDIGLTSNFAPLVLLLGHGSSCINNPHESAYHCGACAGNAGGPNARALAMMLNDIRVRRRLDEIGLAIPDETQFVGGLHNTATEEMTFFDLELLPSRKVNQVRAASRLLAEAARRNAHERCRRFESANLSITSSEALLHVQNRSEDLAETRPEYGNGSNAICFVGRRQRVRGLYLDRRSFMMSYDATLDSADSMILARILAAVVPVCEGINLLYTFSAIDPIGWGSGTKLPHNITSLLGVMDGAASDLRPGLPWQGVDIHEPLRLLFIIEASTDALLKLMNENTTLKNIFRNHWSHLATLDPRTNQMHRFSKDGFVVYHPEEPDSLPRAASSWDWYHGKREHLSFALIENEATAATLDSGDSTTNLSASQAVSP